MLDFGSCSFFTDLSWYMAFGYNRLCFHNFIMNLINYLFKRMYLNHSLVFHVDLFDQIIFLNDLIDVSSEWLNVGDLIFLFFYSLHIVVSCLEHMCLLVLIYFFNFLMNIVFLDWNVGIFDLVIKYFDILDNWIWLIVVYNFLNNFMDVIVLHLPLLYWSFHSNHSWLRGHEHWSFDSRSLPVHHLDDFIFKYLSDGTTCW